MDEDGITVTRLTSEARRCVPGREPSEAETAAAADDLREIAGNRGDLLAEVAGLLMGFYQGTTEELRANAAACFCRAAGADPNLIPQWVELGRRRAVNARTP